MGEDCCGSFVKLSLIYYDPLVVIAITCCMLHSNKRYNVIELGHYLTNTIIVSLCVCLMSVTFFWNFGRFGGHMTN